uniref:GP4 n=1 Tax=Kibale red colobus virus 1 TaxID=1885929 RepID=A0A1L5YNL9_9NIDO|nr:GP4 [Kibale red colobus virus 1]APP93329.1 GP4 [Kibale red colobus virus 1]
MHHPTVQCFQQYFTRVCLAAFLTIGGHCATASTTVPPTSTVTSTRSFPCQVTCIPCHFNHIGYGANFSQSEDVNAYSIDCATHFLAGKSVERAELVVDNQNIISLLALQMCIARGLALSTTNHTVYFRTNDSTITHLCYAPFQPATHTRSPSPYVLKWGAAITCLLGIAISIK